MAICIMVITGLQFYWNYRNFERTVATFRQNANAALKEAVDLEIDERHQKLIDSLKIWMNDTAVVQITCENNNRKRATVFHMKDTHPLNPQEKGVAIGITKFKESLTAITPSAKKTFIEHFTNNIVRNDLRKGFVYNYTQRLGEKLLAAFESSKLSSTRLDQLFEKQLQSKGLHIDFLINPKRNSKALPYPIGPVNTALRRPYETELVTVAIQSPTAYFFGEMKWLLLSSFLLLGIMIFCFVYTLKTLFSQHQLTLLKNDFVNNMTHEINTPIASILITVQSLKTFEHNREVQSEFYDIIDYQAGKLKWLASQLLEAGKIEKRRADDLETVELNGLVNKSIADMAVQLNSAKASIDLSATTAIKIKGDAQNLINAFTNIIDNALKYTLAAPKIDIKIWQSHQWANISFADNGIGIPEIYRSKVFEDFFRVPKGNVHDVKGYGLGLSYVNQVVKKHKGTLSITENHLAGTIFTFRFPLAL